MEYRTLDLTLISAKDLKDVQLIGKQDVYAVVSINGDESTKQKSKVDKDCGVKPKWNQTFKFTIDEAAAQQNRLTFVIHIMADRPLAGDKLLGEVHVPVKELLDGKTGKSDYSVRMPNGKSKGSLNLSYKFGEKFSTGPPPVADQKPGLVMDLKTGHDEPAMAYPPQAGYPGSSSVYNPYPPPGQGYPAQSPYPAPGGYPPHGYAAGYPAGQGYPPQGQYGYPPQGQYGYPPQGPAGYPGAGYQQPQPKKDKKKKHGGAGMGLGLGLGAGLLGGLLVGEIVDDVADAAGGFDDFGGGFDF